VYTPIVAESSLDQLDVLVAQIDGQINSLDDVIIIIKLLLA
jgi:hypothetical protein